MNNAAASNLTVLLTDPHMRYPVIILVLLEIAKAWFPIHSDQIDQTEKLVGLYLASVAYRGTDPAPVAPPAKP